VILQRTWEPTRDFDALNQRFSETTDANERIELLGEMCKLIQMAHLVLKCQVCEFWH